MDKNFLTRVAAQRSAPALVPVAELEKEIVKQLTADHKRNGKPVPRFVDSLRGDMKKLARATIIEQSGYDDEGEQLQAATAIGKVVNAEPKAIVYAARDAYDAIKARGKGPIFP